MLRNFPRKSLFEASLFLWIHQRCDTKLRVVFACTTRNCRPVCYGLLISEPRRYPDPRLNNPSFPFDRKEKGKKRGGNKRTNVLLFLLADRDRCDPRINPWKRNKVLLAGEGMGIGYYGDWGTKAMPTRGCERYVFQSGIERFS